MTTASASPLLQMTGVSKSFPGVQALADVSFDLYPGEVHALMGENGAGKSTLMKILAGAHIADAGTIEIDGRPVEITSPQVAAAHGIAVIHQELNSVPNMTVAENLAIGREPKSRWGTLDRRQLRRDAIEKMERVGLELDPNKVIGQLSVGLQQMIEIARALAQDARIIVLDEPTAALSEGEATRLFELVAEMRSRGIGLIYISHRMEEVYRLADRISVFRDGRWVDTMDRSESTPSRIVTRMVGRDMGDLYARERERTPSEVVLEAVGITDGVSVGPVDLQLRAGEVVGLAGLIGAGRSEVMRMLFGVDRMRRGEVRLHGQPAEITAPPVAKNLRIGFVPESRKEQAIFASMTITDNVTVSKLDQLCTAGVLHRKSVARTADEQIRSLNIRASSRRQHLAKLSGGNQQKVVLGRWLSMTPDVLLLDEPTRGVDIGAKNEIYRIIDRLASEGVAICVVSSDLPEVIGISDRILVMRHGQIVAEIDRADATEESVMLYATGVATEGTKAHSAETAGGAVPVE